MKLFLITFLFCLNSIAQVSNSTIDANIVGGSVTVTGTSSVNVTNASLPVTKSGTWNIDSIVNPVEVTGTFWQATQPVSIASSVAVTGPLTDTQLRASAVPVSGNLGRTWSILSSTDSTSAWLKDGAGNSITSSAAGAQRPLDVQLHNSAGNPFGTNANPLRVDPTGTTSQPVLIATLPSLAAGTNAIGSITNTSFGISGTLPAFAVTPTFNLGTLNGAALDTSVNSLLKPASTLAAVTTVGTITNPVTVSAGTNLNTSALNLEATQSAMSAKLPSVLGQGTMATSMKVVLPSDQSAIPVSQSGVFTHRTQDGLGNAIASIDDGNGAKALEVAQGATSFVFSTANSTVAQLAAGATFTGTVETVTNQQSASVLLTTDQNGTLVLREYIDAAGLRQSRVSTYAIAANVPFSRSFVVNGNYFRAAFTNNGGATTTTLNLNTAYGAIPSATALGNGQVSLDEINGTAFVGATKGVQPALALPTQDLKDSGRVKKIFSATFTAATTEALVTLTPITDGVAGTTATSFSVTVGKRFRLQSVCISTRNAGAAAQGVVIQVRQTSTGAITAASPLIGTVAAGTGIAVANVSASNCYTFSDGIELSGTEQFGVSQVGSATANNNVVLTGFEY